MRRGDVVWADLNPRSGSEQQGRRPVVVVSHDGFNQATGWRSIIIVPVTKSASQASRGPTAVLLPAGAGGLRSSSIALCHQVTTLDRGKLGEPVGRLAASDMARVESGLKAALDLR
jgi:mRNA interferase MazF